MPKIPEWRGVKGAECIWTPERQKTPSSNSKLLYIVFRPSGIRNRHADPVLNVFVYFLIHGRLNVGNNPISYTKLSATWEAGLGRAGRSHRRRFLRWEGADDTPLARPADRLLQFPGVDVLGNQEVMPEFLQVVPKCLAVRQHGRSGLLHVGSKKERLDRLPSETVQPVHCQAHFPCQWKFLCRKFLNITIPQKKI